MSNVNPASRIIPTSSRTRTETRLPAARSLVVIIIVVVIVPIVVIVIFVPVVVPVVFVPIVVIPVIIIVLFNDYRGSGLDGMTRGGVRWGGLDGLQCCR